MPLAVVGASHRTAPIELRERFTFGRAEIPGALVELSADGSEAVILSTCNRTEVYLSLPDGSDGVEQARGLDRSREGARESDDALVPGQSLPDPGRCRPGLDQERTPAPIPAAHLGLDEAGTDHVHPDAGWGKQRAQGQAIGEDTRLAGAVAR